MSRVRGSLGRPAGAQEAALDSGTALQDCSIRLTGSANTTAPSENLPAVNLGVRPGGPAAVAATGGGVPAEASAGPPRWEKVLWKRQPFPDNYVDHTFLEHLVVNDAVPRRRYWPVVLASTAVTQQMSCVAAAAAVTLHLQAGRTGPWELLAACGVLLLLGYATCAVLGGQLLGGSVARGVRQCMLLVGGVYGLAPLLHSLTATVSSDSVVALAAGLAAAHLALCDYSFVNSVTDKMTGALSLAAAVLAAVLVAGRMRTELETFAVVLLALVLFLLSPYARRHVRRASVPAHLLLTAASAAAATALLFPASPAAAGAFAGCVVVVTLVCPAALVRGHVFKAKISGPWDEAAPHIPRQLMPRKRPAPGAAEAAAAVVAAAVGGATGVGK
ncbi:hypothetical protein HYH02_005972 [Chlamydomonas schloesseri]|uniref:Phosphatidylinositol N-acetylglucosaminyltransferase subunit C n=1 Tax=Chlamydomonas schloesseri TaxID=2026947 RepID=A0A836B6M7_9CHLO|nr:hypothetical protein HYH02_005972 [Chlamydomonas schloesseri]|eukprot:KAG2449226.1 hypothetical protein HYH02_005972 [Chlamydomonas schloesseri]